MEDVSYGLTLGAASGFRWIALPVVVARTSAGTPTDTANSGPAVPGASAMAGPLYGTGAGPVFGAAGIWSGAAGGVSAGITGIGHHAFACRYSLVLVASATVCTILNRMYGPRMFAAAVAPAAMVTAVKSASAVAPSVPYSMVTTVVPP